MKNFFYFGVVVSLLFWWGDDSCAAERKFQHLGKYHDVTITSIGLRGIEIMHSTGGCWITANDLSDSEKAQLQEVLDKIEQLQKKYQEREQARSEYLKKQQEQANNIVSVLKEMSAMPSNQAIEFLQKKRVAYANSPNINLLDEKIIELKNELQEDVWVANLSDFSGKSYGPKDMERLIKRAREVQDCYAKAMQGDADAQCQMAMYYSQTDGTAITGKPDYHRALKWLRKAAKQGHALALYSLGCFYMTGDGGGAIDKKSALRYWLAAAEKGLSDAQYSTGKGYSSGDFNNGNRNEKEAQKWLLLAAQQNHVDAQYSLGWLYRLSNNDADAKSWWRKAAQNKHEKAKHALWDYYKEKFVRIFSEQEILNSSDLSDCDIENSAKVYVTSYIKEKFDNIDHNCLDPQKMYQCERGTLCSGLSDMNVRVEFRNFPNGALAVFPQNTADYAVIVELERIQKQIQVYNTRYEALKAKIEYEGSQFNIPAVTQYSNEGRNIISKHFFYQRVGIDLQYALAMKMLSKTKKCSALNIDLLSNPLPYGNYVCVVLPDGHVLEIMRYAGFSIDGTPQRIKFDCMNQLNFK